MSTCMPFVCGSQCVSFKVQGQAWMDRLSWMANQAQEGETFWTGAVCSIHSCREGALKQGQWANWGAQDRHWEVHCAADLYADIEKDMKNGARIVPKISNLRSKQARQTRLTFEKWEIVVFIQLIVMCCEWESLSHASHVWNSFATSTGASTSKRQRGLIKSDSIACFPNFKFTFQGLSREGFCMRLIVGNQVRHCFQNSIPTCCC